MISIFLLTNMLLVQFIMQIMNSFSRTKIKNPNQSRARSIKKLGSSKPHTQAFKQKQQRWETDYQSKNHIPKIGSPHLATSYQQLAMIQAYCPDFLKQCLVKSRKSLTKANSKGECNLTDMFLKGALINFRDWREKIYQHLLDIIDYLTSSEDLLEGKEEQKIRESIKQLKNYSSKITNQIERLIASPQQSFKLTKMHEKYQFLSEIIKHVLILINCMHNLSQDIRNFLVTIRNFDSQSLPFVKKGVEQIVEKRKIQVQDALNFCVCNPNNKTLLNLQFRVRSMLFATAQKVLGMFSYIKQLRAYQARFKEKMILLQNCQGFSLEYLQQALQLLINKNQQLKSIQRKTLLTKQPDYIALKAKIEDWETNFIKQLRPKFLSYLSNSLKNFSTLRTLHLIKSHTKQYLHFKKVLLILVKVLQQSQKQSNIEAQYYQFQKKIVSKIIEMFSIKIKEISPILQDLQERVEKIIDYSQTNPIKGLKGVKKLQQQIGSIQKNQSQIWKLINEAYIQLCRIQNKNPQNYSQGEYSDRKQLSYLHELLVYSRSEESNQFFKIFEPSLKKYSKNISSQDIKSLLQQYELKYMKHLKFVKQQLLKGLQKWQQLKEILRQQLIGYIFQSQFSLQFISGYQNVRQITTIDDKMSVIIPKQYINNVKFYKYGAQIVEQFRKGVNQQISKLQKSKSRNLFNRYIVFLYEAILINILNIKGIYGIFISKQDNISQYQSSLQSYSLVYQGVIVKTKREDSEFGLLCTRIYEISEQLNAQNKFVNGYISSFWTNLYFPACSFIQQWMEYQFSGLIEETITKQQCMAKRSEVKLLFSQFTKRLESQINKIRDISKSEPKAISQHIRNILNILSQFNFQQQYCQILRKIMKYLKVMQISHTMIYSQDQSPIFILINVSDIQSTSKIILRRFHLRSKNSKINLIPFTPKEYEKFHSSTLQNPKIKVISKQIKPNQIKENVIQEICQGEFQEQIVEDKLFQEFSQQLPISSIINQIQQSDSKQIKAKEADSSHLSISAIKIYSYFKCPQISSLDQLRNLLLYHKDELKIIKSSLRLQKLCYLLNNPNDKQASQHLKEIVKHMKSNSLYKIIGTSDVESQNLQYISNFVSRITNSNNNLDETLKFLQYFSISRLTLYQKGNNKIELFTKYGQQQGFMYCNLNENNYQLQLRNYYINKILMKAWNSQTKQHLFDLRSVNQQIQHSNTKIAEYYNEIYRALNVLQGKTAINKKQIEEKIQKYFLFVTNNKKLLSLCNETSKKEVIIIEWISKFQKQVSNIGAIQPYYRLFLDQHLIYFDSEKIPENIIYNQLLLPQGINFPFKISIKYEEMSIRISSIEIKRQIESMIKKEKLDFKLAEKFLKEIKKDNILLEIQTKAGLQNTLKIFENYLTFYDPQQQKRVTNILSEIRTELKFLNVLKNISQKQLISRVQQYCLNQQFKLIQNQSSQNYIRYFNPCILNLISSQAILSNINHQIIKYKESIIYLTDTYQIKTIISILSMSQQSLQKKTILQNQMFHEENVYTINRLFINLVNLVPKFNKYGIEVENNIKQLLSHSSIEVKSSKKVITVNCLQIFEKGDNKIEIDVEWPKDKIELKLITLNQKIIKQLQANNYSYFSDLQVLPFSTYFRQQFKTIQKKHKQSEKIKLEEQRIEIIKKQQHDKQIQKLKQEQQISKLKNQQEMAKIIFQTEQINRKNRQKETQQRVRLKFIQQITLKKLKEQYQVNRNKNSQQYKIKLNKLSEALESNNNQPSQGEQMQIQLVLSQGQDEHFNNQKHTKQYDYEYQYKKTLYHHIQSIYHNRRKAKTIDIQQWL